MTTIAVSDETAAALASLKKAMGASSFDECVKKLVATFRGKEESLFGIDKGRIDTRGLRDHYDRSF